MCCTQCAIAHFKDEQSETGGNITHTESNILKLLHNAKLKELMGHLKVIYYIFNLYYRVFTVPSILSRQDSQSRFQIHHPSFSPVVNTIDHAHCG